MTARETVHTHGCLNCRPDMVPDFTRDDPRYHDGDKCGRLRHAWERIAVDGVTVVGYTKGALEGPEGWVLFVGAATEDVHHCPTCTTRDADGCIERSEICVTPFFGNVSIPLAPPIMRDLRDVLDRLPKGWPTAEATPEARATFAEGWETFFLWLHREARA